MIAMNLIHSKHLILVSRVITEMNLGQIFLSTYGLLGTVIGTGDMEVSRTPTLPYGRKIISSFWDLSRSMYLQDFLEQPLIRYVGR